MKMDESSSPKLSTEVTYPSSKSIRTDMKIVDSCVDLKIPNTTEAINLDLDQIIDKDKVKKKKRKRFTSHRNKISTVVSTTSSEKMENKLRERVEKRRDTLSNSVENLQITSKKKLKPIDTDNSYIHKLRESIDSIPE